MTDESVGRWPPIYDADELKKQIRELALSPTTTNFYTSVEVGPAVCQGDIVTLKQPAPVPVIDRDGEVVAVGAPMAHWLVIGNTCDFARPVSLAEWTQLVPVYEVDGSKHPEADLGKLQRYELSRLFYVPPWPGSHDRHRFANFLQPVALHKEAIPSSVQVVARMRRAAWILLHSALIRFLARDDGRFDNDDDDGDDPKGSYALSA